MYDILDGTVVKAVAGVDLISDGNVILIGHPLHVRFTRQVIHIIIEEEVTVLMECRKVQQLLISHFK